MNIDPIYLIYAFLAVGCFLLVEGVYYLLIDIRGVRRDPNRRLRMLSAGKGRDAVLVSLRRQRSFTAEGGPLVWLESLVVQSGAGSGVTKVAALMILLALGGLVLVYLITLKAVIALAAGAAAGLLPVAFLALKRRGRIRRFERQFPDALDMMVRGLRAGHPVSSALMIVAREMPDPIGSEIGVVLDEVTYGFELEVALKNLRARVGLPDVGFLVVAVSIQAQLGGNLAEILSNLARVVRERLKMKLKIKAASAEGRFSAFVLSVVPFVLMAVLTTMNPGFYADVWDDPLFLPGMTAAFVMMIVGIIVMWRLVNFRI